MPELQTLLREAAGTHEVPDLRAAHRARRRRRTRLRAGVAAVVVLAAGAGLVSSVGGGSSDRVHTVASALVEVTPGVERLAIGEPVTGLALDGRALWVATGDHLHKVDRATGALRPKAVPSYLRARRVVAGPGIVWAIGKGTGEYGPEGSITALDGRRAVTSSGTNLAPIDLTTGFGSAWITDKKAGLIRATSVDGRLETVDIALGRIGFARDVVVTDDAVWVLTLTDELLQVDPATNRVVARHHWAGRLYRATSGQGIWTTDGGRVIELVPELIDEKLGIRSARGRTGPAVKGFVSDVLETSAGLWVAQRGRVRLYAVDGGRVGRQLASLALPAGELPELSGAGRSVWISDELGVAAARRWTVPAR